MKYLWSPNTSMKDMPEDFGVIVSPRNWGIKKGIKEGRWWALDNDCFNGGFDADKFFWKLDQLSEYKDKCLFITCPDILGNARETIDSFYLWADKIREYGPLAFVAQDGLRWDDYSGYFYAGSEMDFTDWCDKNNHRDAYQNETLYMDCYEMWRSEIDPDDFDWLFIGGTTEFKLGYDAKDCIRGAKSINKLVHVGRVNSRKRYRIFKSLGCDSADGTNANYGNREESKQRWIKIITEEK